jgi:hypothetical protein
MDLNLLVTLAVILLLAAIAAAALARHRRSRQPARRTAAGYHRTGEAMARRGRTEDRMAGEPRVQAPEIVPLPAHEAQRFRMEWQGLQARFADSPRSAVAEADLLVRDVMLRRGFPMGEFDLRADELSVNHRQVVEHYRTAHAIAVRDQHDQADAEALRQALAHYRALFSELLAAVEETVPRRAPTHERASQRTFRGIQPPERALARGEPVTRDRERRSER